MVIEDYNYNDFPAVAFAARIDGRDQDTFVPAAKLVANGECFSIVSDYLGTPMQAYDKNGEKVWEQELDIYGRQRKRPSAFIPFKYQGQYEDAETGLYYNRFRYYDPNAGSYISQDPIGLVGENPTLYSHVKSPNSQLDLLGLDVYALVATHDGWYPVYEYGTKDPIAYTKQNLMISAFIHFLIVYNLELTTYGKAISHNMRMINLKNF